MYINIDVNKEKAAIKKAVKKASNKVADIKKRGADATNNAKKRLMKTAQKAKGVKINKKRLMAFSVAAIILAAGLGVYADEFKVGAENTTPNNSTTSTTSATEATDVQTSITYENAPTKGADEKGATAVSTGTTAATREVVSYKTVVVEVTSKEITQHKAVSVPTKKTQSGTTKAQKTETTKAPSTTRASETTAERTTEATTEATTKITTEATTEATSFSFGIKLENDDYNPINGKIKIVGVDNDTNKTVVVNGRITITLPNGVYNVKVVELDGQTVNFGQSARVDKEAEGRVVIFTLPIE